MTLVSTFAAARDVSYSDHVTRVHPFLMVIFFYAVVAVCGGLTPPKPLMRLGAIAIVLLSAAFSLRHIDRCRTSLFWLKTSAECICGVALFANQFIYLLNASPPRGSNLAQKLSWAVGIELNPRGIRTPWQVRNLVPFSKRDRNYVPPRGSFIARRIATGLLFYAMYTAFLYLDYMYYENLQESDHSRPKDSIIRRLGDVSMRELYVRAWLPVDFIFGVWCVHQYWHCLLSVIAVALGDEPCSWPPLYGDIREAYSLRRLWGVFWHQVLRAAFVSNGSFIAQTFLRIPKESPIHRQAITLVAFCLSGGIHAVGLWAMAPTCGVRPVVEWHVLMGLAMALEDLAVWVIAAMRGGRAVGRQWSVFGYVWVWAYLAWSLPKIRYRMADCGFGCGQ